jgi:hypothetical protein
MVKPQPPLITNKSEATGVSADFLPSARAYQDQHRLWARDHRRVMQELEQELAWDALIKNMGYTRVDYFFRSMSIVDNWMAANCRGDYQRSGHRFLFELESDASKFIMFWKVRMIEHLNKFIPE